MRKQAAIAGVVAIAVAGGVGSWLLLGRVDEPWPPRWYVDPSTNRAEYAALRKRAIATASTKFPPGEATLTYLRNLAVGSVTQPGERLHEARVFEGSGYVLQLRGRFSTARIGPSPPGWKPERAFEPCLTLGFDPSTLFTVHAALGRCEDLSALGESIELDLREESS